VFRRNRDRCSPFTLEMWDRLRGVWIEALEEQVGRLGIGWQALGWSTVGRMGWEGSTRL